MQPTPLISMALKDCDHFIFGDAALCSVLNDDLSPVTLISAMVSNPLQGTTLIHDVAPSIDRLDGSPFRESAGHVQPPDSWCSGVSIVPSLTEQCPHSDISWHMHHSSLLHPRAHVNPGKL